MKSHINRSRTISLNQNVTLGTLSLECAQDMFRWMRDPNVSRNIGLRDKPSLEKTLSWVSLALQDPLIYPFSILFNGQHVGNVILDRVDNYLGNARVSFYLGDSSHRGKGIGLTGIYLALQEGFDTFSLHKIYLTAHVENLPSRNIAAKLGFALEGTLRDEFILDEKRVDLLYFGLLETDFRQLHVEQPL
jgi:RimJ/RimL family protein N-acetyltransferase